MDNPYQRTLVDAYTNATQFDDAYQSVDGQYHVVPIIPELQKGSGCRTGHRKTEFFGPEFILWRGSYCIWHLKERDVFYVCRQARKVQYKGKAVVSYESVPDLSKGKRSPTAVDERMLDIANGLRRSKY